MIVDLLNSGVLVRSIMAIIAILVASYIAVAQYAIPDWFQIVLSVVIGYYFGADTPFQTRQIIQSRVNGEPK